MVEREGGERETHTQTEKETSDLNVYAHNLFYIRRLFPQVYIHPPITLQRVDIQGFTNGKHLQQRLLHNHTYITKKISEREALKHRIDTYMHAQKPHYSS